MSRFQVQGTGAYFWVEDIEAPPMPPREPGRMCRSQLYKTFPEAMAVRNWLHERSLGYPRLDLPWHAIGCMSDGRPIPQPTIATRSG